jgi:7,8-dihydropterin-6-yl-methyl-4-(beta-D-ribofuranosyl)aminobenzene 5'-phosphate synthase
MQNIASVDRVKLMFLVEDTVGRPNLTAKHGLSCLIEINSAASNSKILMDAGPPPDPALRNADLLSVDFSKLDMIFISHGHYDHLGGLQEILKRIRKPIPIIIHPLAFAPKFSLTTNLKFIGTEFDERTAKELYGILVFARNSVPVASGVITSGEISRETGFEKVEGFRTVENGYFIEDHMVDDQALFMNLRDQGLVILTGCGHSGIINTVKQAQKMTGIEKIHAIIGGCHLANATQERLEVTTSELQKIQPDRLYPCHCTGAIAIDKFHEAFGERCRPAHTGDIIEL